MRSLIVIGTSAVLFVAACVHEGASPADDATPAISATQNIVAHGNEPGWRVTIGADQSDFVLDYGERTFSAPTPAPEMTDTSAIYRYADTDLTLTISDVNCADDMSGMPYPKTALLEEGGRSLNGCAGETVNLLIGEEWVVEDIGGGGVIDFARTSMLFGDDGKVSGSGACNRFGGTYALTGEGLSFGPIAATKKACPPAVMDQENRFFDAIEITDRFEIDDTGALILIGADQPLLTARR